MNTFGSSNTCCGRYLLSPHSAGRRGQDCVVSAVEGASAHMKKSRFVALAVLALALAVGGIAFAYWTQGGSGSGGATAGTTTAITVNQTGAPTGLYPGGPAQALCRHVHEPERAPGPHQLGDRGRAPVLGRRSTARSRRAPQADFVVGGSHGRHRRARRAPTCGSWSGLTVRLAGRCRQPGQLQGRDHHARLHRQRVVGASSDRVGARQASPPAPGAIDLSDMTPSPAASCRPSSRW